MKKVILMTKRCLNFLLFGLCLSMPLFAAPSDYDGDGKTDFAVRRINSDNSHTWFILQSRDGFRAGNFGRTSSGKFGDFPQAGDYDGDGKTDPAVFRFGQEYNYYILQSRDGFKVVQWGRYPDSIVSSNSGVRSQGF